jgi:hypothetical protein
LSSLLMLNNTKDLRRALSSFAFLGRGQFFVSLPSWELTGAGGIKCQPGKQQFQKGA